MFPAAFDMISSQKHAPMHLGRVLILGLGKSGRAASEYCFDLLGTRVDSLTIAAGKRNEEAALFVSHFESEKLTVSFDTYDFEESYDLCIASPGIPECSSFYQNARAVSRELISEVEFAWRESAKDSRWIAITGTNGKTTTTSLTAHILKEAGLNAAAVGNIGDTCLEAVSRKKTDIYVVEVSSYQLASTVYFRPDIAVLLNITPDHLDWHGSFEEYAQAKFKMFKNLGHNGECFSHDLGLPLAIFDTTDDEVRRFVKQIKNIPLHERGYNYLPIGTASGLEGDMRHVCGSENAAYLNDGILRIAIDDKVYDLIHTSSLRIKGEHNRANALAAASAALALGIKADKVSQALCSFAPLEHRIEPCGSVEGVACFNDSKATNVDATIKALSAFEKNRVVVLLGGYDKGTDLSELVAEVEKHCKAAICFGAAGPRFFEAFSLAEIPVFLNDTLEAALDHALSQAHSGDAVLLSPACASFDEFTSFEQRGKTFKGLVRRRSEERGV